MSTFGVSLHFACVVEGASGPVGALALDLPSRGPLPDLRLTDIHWVIVGGESGPKRRPINPAWVRDIRDQCLATGVPFFFKQWGGRVAKSGGRLLDRRTWDEMPADDVRAKPDLHP